MGSNIDSNIGLAWCGYSPYTTHIKRLILEIIPDIEPFCEERWVMFLFLFFGTAPHLRSLASWPTLGQMARTSRQRLEAPAAAALQEILRDSHSPEGASLEECPRIAGKLILTPTVLFHRFAYTVESRIDVDCGSS